MFQTSRRSNNATHESDVNPSNNHTRTSELPDSNQVRPVPSTPSVPPSSTIATKLRPNHVHFNRSQSQADLIASSKLAQQRATSNNSLGLQSSPSPSTPATPSTDHIRTTICKTPPSSANAALMMINKHHPTNSSSSSLPSISTHHHHHHHANKISLSDKHYSSHS